MGVSIRAEVQARLFEGFSNEELDRLEDEWLNAVASVPYLGDRTKNEVKWFPYPRARNAAVLELEVRLVGGDHGVSEEKYAMVVNRVIDALKRSLNATTILPPEVYATCVQSNLLGRYELVIKEFPET